MPTRNISLTEHFDAFVDEKIASGRYLNASEVIREGLRLLEQKSEEERTRLARLREAAGAGFEAIDKGEYRELGHDQVGRHIAELGRRARKAG